jgi:hypothetical protein
VRWLLVAVLSLLQWSAGSAPLDVSTLAVAPPMTIVDLTGRSVYRLASVAMVRAGHAAAVAMMVRSRQSWMSA